MDPGLTATGQERSWSLMRKLGEGDAGEVFLVESLLDNREAILKRPRRSAFSSDTIRQATQIEIEGKILQAIAGASHAANRSPAGKLAPIHVPGLIDRSQPGTEFSERFFIVLERAQGFDLNFLARTSRYGQVQLDDAPASQRLYVDAFSRLGHVPRLIVLRALTGLFHLFQEIHNAGQSGIIWNDVKPDHLFWDPHRARVTVIDWGNARFLEADGYDKDRRLSKFDDYAQLIQAFHTFLADHKPDLLDDLAWPEGLAAGLNASQLINPLKQRVLKLLDEEVAMLQEARQVETALVNSDLAEVHGLEQLFAAQEQIIGSGEIPDYQSSNRFCTRLATSLATAGQLEEFAHLSSLACHIHADDPQKWLLLGSFAKIATQVDAPENVEINQALGRSIQDGLFDNWPAALWRISAAVKEHTRPAWFDDLVGQIRQAGLGIAPGNPPPLTVVKRAALTMQSDLQKKRDGLEPGREHTSLSVNGSIELGDSDVDCSSRDSEDECKEVEALLKTLKEEVIPRWSQPEPDPPDSGIEYSDINRCLDKIGRLAPSIQQTIQRSLEQPNVHARATLEAWNERNFEAARQGLRGLLIWDTDRLRVFQADHAIAHAQRWLDAIHQGAKPDQMIQEFAANLEIYGRELRSQVGSADWLDLLLQALAHIRKGRRPGELLTEYPDLANDMPWLDILEPRKYVPSQPARLINMERESAAPGYEPLLFGMKEGGLGPEQDFLMGDSLDTWAPEARGSSARAFTGFLRTTNNQLKLVAVKIMRGDRRDYALPLFREEAQVLSVMRDVSGVIPMLECGFIRLDAEMQLPPDTKSASARGLTGSIQRYGPDQVQVFLSNLETQAQLGMLPYIITPKLDNDDNLMWLCDIGYTRGSFLPIEEDLRLAVQICEILMTAHERNVVYRDHKLLHYYWQELYNGVFTIDWNVARYHPQGLSRAEIQADLVQLGARCLHHIFTGRVAPGALADGPTRPDEIESAAQSYRTQWTYDDQRLPPDLKNILEELLAGNYTRASRLRDDLIQVYQRLIDDRENSETERSAGE